MTLSKGYYFFSGWQDLLSSMNFARNFIDDLLLPWGVERIIYMDVDTIVQSDLRTLWAVKFKAGHFYGPAHTCNQPWSFWFNFKSWVIYNSLLKVRACLCTRAKSLARFGQAAFVVSGGCRGSARLSPAPQQALARPLTRAPPAGSVEFRRSVCANLPDMEWSDPI